MKQVYKLTLVSILLLTFVACNKQKNINSQITTMDMSSEEVVAELQISDTSEEEFTTDDLLSDSWVYNSSTIPTDVVQSAIENQKQKEYTLKVEVREVVVDDRATERAKQRYIGSDLAKKKGWSDTYLENNMIAVFAEYYVEYDHKKTPLDDGEIKKFFILLRNEETKEWGIWTNTTNGDEFN